ncbi:glycosyltransferase [uncultured Thiodictyon sp.]|uniref:glycosyltransferase n=1 Tax=uncultured Thiodictyon sp. TaxID=1846217 RepID=UPI0025EB7238|nr:glycosyltransferase [uncultured Thiodictyon sp.]
MGVEHIALVVSDFEDGGVERNLTNLARGLARLGVATSLLVGDPDHAYLQDLEPGLRVLRVTEPRTQYLSDFMRRERPGWLVTGKLADDLAALAARSALPPAAGGATRLVAAVGTLMSGRFATYRWNLWKTWRETGEIHACYHRLHGITAVSQAVAEDLAQVFGVTQVPIAVLNNPILPDDLADLAAAPCPHPWLAQPKGGDRPPVIIALGGLRKVKDFATLLRAFAAVDRPSARLLIIGEGKERHRLSGLARRLGIAGRVHLAGFIANPFPYLARADLLALSSRREGLPNALVEAMALGIPVVATDCTGGVRDLLQDGRLGALVPVGDMTALAGALDSSLHQLSIDALDRTALPQAAEPYRLIPAARTYLEFFRSLPAPGG